MNFNNLHTINEDLCRSTQIISKLTSGIDILKDKYQTQTKVLNKEKKQWEQERKKLERNIKQANTNSEKIVGVRLNSINRSIY